MDKCVVAVVSSSQARFFTLEEAEWPEYESGPNLIKQSSLTPSQIERDRGFWYKLTHKKHHQKSPANEHHHPILDKKFAQNITSEIISLIRIHQGRKLILVAKPQIVNSIRKLFTPTLFNNLEVREVPKNLSHFDVNQIHQYLAFKKLIPACQKVVYPL